MVFTLWMEKTYKVKYHVEPGSFSKSELEENPSENLGGCDRLFIISIVEDSAGNVSYLPMGVDPDQENGVMTVDDYFRCWTMLASVLSQKLPKGGRRDTCTFVFEHIREAILKGRK